MFDLNNGKFEDYQQEEDNEIYQMLKEMKKIVKNDLESLEQANSSDDEVDQIEVSKDNKWVNQKKYKPQMTDIVEETEPESSFKETKLHKRNKSDNIPEVIAEDKTEDRDDDFSDDSDDTVNISRNELRDFTFIPGSKPGDNKGHTFLQKQAEMID